MNYEIFAAIIAGVVAGLIVEIASKKMGLKLTIGGSLIACASTTAIVLMVLI